MNNLDNDGCAGGMRCKAPDALHGHSLQADGNDATRPPVQSECSSYSWTDPYAPCKLESMVRWDRNVDASLKVNGACTREATLGCRWHDGSTAAVQQSSFQRIYADPLSEEI